MNSESKIQLLAGARFSLTGPLRFFLVSPELQDALQKQGRVLSPGDTVIVETETGELFAEVSVARHMDPEQLLSRENPDLGMAIALAAEEDVAQARKNAELAAEAGAYCKECIRERDLDMKLVDVEVTQDRSKMAFYFTAPARIDFRELVKDLVRKYRTRIDLRQIGVRHETQMLGAVGNCGMVCCCRRYLRNFTSVAIKMAKEQNIFLNPAKISGICGRLLCCLAYEQENYEEFYRRCPKLGKRYHTSRGSLRVLRANLFRESVSVLSDTNEEEELSLEEWNSIEARRQDGASAPAQRNVKR